MTRITPAEGFDEGRLLELAALAESASSHPISKSLQKAYGQELDRSRVGQVEERSGAGVVAEVDGKSVAAGNDKLMNQLGVAFQESENPVLWYTSRWTASMPDRSSLPTASSPVRRRPLPSSGAPVYAGWSCSPATIAR